MPPLQSRTRTQIRQSIGYNLADMVLVTASSTVDTSSLIATYSLAKGGDDEYNGRQVICITPAGSIVAAEKSWVKDYAKDPSFDATVAPVFSANITVDDVFEMWNVFTYEEINDAINQAITEVSNKAIKIKQTANTYKDPDEYEYACLADFVALSKVEYEYTVAIEKILHRCDAAWAELADPTGVTSSLDTTFKKEGSGSLKLVMIASAATGLLKTVAITSTDLSQCDKLEIWIYSSVALSAGDLQVLLDNTAECASPVESLNIPATTANTWTRHIISLANPENDSAIISVGLKMVVDKGAFNLWADDVKAVLSTSRQYRLLAPDLWELVRDSTDYLKLTKQALSVVSDNKLMRLTGYQLPSLLSADGTTSDIDPAWLIAQVTARLLISHAKSARLDIKDRQGLAVYWQKQADILKPGIYSTPMPNTRWL